MCRNTNPRCYFRIIFVALLFLLSGTARAQVRIDETASPADARLNRSRGLNMLNEIKAVIKQRYYDKDYHGIDLDARFKAAAERIKTMDTNHQIFRVIAQVLIEFNDSHTRFYPPNRANRVEYGFSIQMIGNRCFVTDVKKGSDADSKGLKPGDVIVGIGNYNPSRENLWKINYLIYALDPVEKLKIYLLNPDGGEREIEIISKFKSIEERQKEAEKRRKEKQEKPYRCKEINADAIACRLETFAVDRKYVDKMMDEVGPHKKFILDLRGNSGGYVKTEEYLTGYFFDHDVKVADFIMRDKTRERIAKAKKEDSYKGDLIVLIDSNSASASEVFARVIQLEKRGKIVGDISAGAVMTSNFFAMANERGTDDFLTYSVFGLNITVADLIMSDGKRLENVGVIPDYPVGPTSYAMFERADAVLSYAADLLGAKLAPADAGKFYFIVHKPEDDDDEGKSDDDDN